MGVSMKISAAQGFKAKISGDSMCHVACLSVPGHSQGWGHQVYARVEDSGVWDAGTTSCYGKHRPKPRKASEDRLQKHVFRVKNIRKHYTSLPHTSFDVFETTVNSFSSYGFILIPV
ncbi:hypothetical protein PoB_005246000 [Plakobranchus ocellatus]|uniref:Uncharacterized protein n=1 Tax=Plakobranchus ocellatus TaxID=259542 RepID=A0AAV4C2U2_9GAST|nr:hypothetical protein PoB_005246000 [Plakobranchus ocellatus]